MNKTDFPEKTLEKKPQISSSVWVANSANVVGNVIIKENASIWYNAVARGDINYISIGNRTNIQDGSVLHVENDRACIIGDDVTIGHRAIIHGCTIESGVLIGMGAIILNGALIKKGAIIGAGAVIKENTIVNENELWVGIPGKYVKTVSKSYDKNIKWAAKYVQLKNKYQEKKTH